MEEIMDEDDDVVFENSPLYQHLKDVGMAGNFESSLYANSAAKAPTKSKKQAHINSVMAIVFFLRRWFEYISLCIFPKSSATCTLNLEQRVALLNSKMLTSGDHHWLVSYGLQEKNAEHSNQSYSQVLVIANSALFASVACLWFLYKNSPTNIETSKLIMAAVFFFLSTLIGIYNLASFIKQFYYNHKKANLGRLIIKQLSLMENIDSYIKKSLRNIQEAELIARGFTIISHKVPLMKLENSSLLGRSQRQLQQLREAVFKVSLSQFLEYREGTRQLLQHIRLQSEVDNVANYIANVPEEDLGFEGDLSKIVKEHWSEKDHHHLAEASDNFSLSAIKVVWQTLAIQRSEIIRRIGLTFCPIAQEENRKVLFLPILQQVMTCLVSNTQRHFQELKRVSDIHDISTSKTDQDTCKTNLESGSRGQYGELWTAAHSLNLHLRAAAVRVHTLQEKCDSLNQENNLPSKNIQTELTSLLETINPELKAALACYQEVETKLSKLFVTDKAEIPNLSINTHPVGDNLESIPPQPIELFGLKDDEIKFDDETFEAYTYPDEGNPDERFSNLYQEETEKQRKERQQSLHLLQELRSVLPGRMAVREQLKHKCRGNPDAYNCNEVENQEMLERNDSAQLCKDNIDDSNQDLLNKENGRENCVHQRVVDSGSFYSKERVENQGIISKEMVCSQQEASGDNKSTKAGPDRDKKTLEDIDKVINEKTPDDDNRVFSNEVTVTKFDDYPPITAKHFELEATEHDRTIENEQTGLPSPQFGGLWGMASLASQAASMSSNFQQLEEVFGSDSDESM